MNVIVRLGVLLALSFAALHLASAAFAKSPPDKLAIVGPGLADSIAIADAASLSAFSPRTRGFVSWERGVIAQPPPAVQG